MFWKLPGYIYPCISGCMTILLLIIYENRFESRCEIDDKVYYNYLSLQNF